MLTCRLVDAEDPSFHSVLQHQEGNMWLMPWYVRDITPAMAADHVKNKRNYRPIAWQYFRDWYGKRPPLCVVCPGGARWFIDGIEKDTHQGWKVIGSPPLITATPSIRVQGYHGYLTNGVFSGDV